MKEVIGENSSVILELDFFQSQGANPASDGGPGSARVSKNSGDIMVDRHFDWKGFPNLENCAVKVCVGSRPRIKRPDAIVNLGR